MIAERDSEEEATARCDRMFVSAWRFGWPAQMIHKWDTGELLFLFVNRNRT
jgi:hypothetical protein